MNAEPSLRESAKNHLTSVPVKLLGKLALLGLCLTGPGALAQQADRVDLGRLQTGATVSFVRVPGGPWGVEIAGGTAPRIFQRQPARLEVYVTDLSLIHI